MAFAATRFAAVLVLRLSLGLIDTPGTGPASPAAVPARIERRIQAMGTWLGLSVAGPDRAAALEVSETAAREIARVEALLTTWRPGSPLDSVNTAPPGEPVVLAAELANLLETVFDWSERTGGAFDPTVLPLVRAWDLRGTGRIPDKAALTRALAATGRSHFRIDGAAGRALRLSDDAGIDEGAWGKGYALDRSVWALRRGGVDEALIDLGGQVAAVGRATVAVADPRDRSRPIVWLPVENASVSTSGNSERGRTVAGRRIGHLLDPRTGRPAPDFGSATAVAPSGLAADVLSTAFFVLGPEKGLALSEKLRREGFPNAALFLVIRGDQVEVLASAGLSFQQKEPGPP